MRDWEVELLRRSIIVSFFFLHWEKRANGSVNYVVQAGVVAIYLANPDYTDYISQNANNIPLALKRPLAQTSYLRR